MMMQQRIVEDADDLKKRWSTSIGGSEMAMMLKQGRLDEISTNNNRTNNRHHFAYNNNYNMDYHLNMLSASQENFEKSSAYAGPYYPIKHLMSKGELNNLPSTKQTTISALEDSKKMTSSDELCAVPSYPWSNQFNNNSSSNNNNNNNNSNNNMSSAEYNRNLIIATNQRNRNFNFNLSQLNNNNNNNNNNHQPFQNHNNDNNEKVKAINSLCNSNGKIGIGGINGIGGILSLKSIFAPTESERLQLEKRVLPLSADEAFQRNQLAPLVFLKNPLWSNLVPSNFVARAWSCFLTLPCEAYFFIEPKKEKGLFSTRHYIATVTGPDNCICPFQMRVEADEYGKEIRYAYMFRPSEEGVYTVKVRLAANGSPHISESPLSIRVCQNPDTIKQQKQQQIQPVQHHSNQFHHHQHQSQQQHNRTSPIRSGTSQNGRLITYQNNSNNNNNHNNTNANNSQPGKNKANGRIGLNTVTTGPPHNQMSRQQQQCHSGSGNYHNFQ